MRTTGHVATPGATANLSPPAEPDFRLSAPRPARSYLGSEHATTQRSRQPGPFLESAPHSSIRTAPHNVDSAVPSASRSGMKAHCLVEAAARTKAWSRRSGE